MVQHQRLAFDFMVVLDFLKWLKGLDYLFRPNIIEKNEKKPDNLSSRANPAIETQKDQCCSMVSHEYLKIHKELRADIWYYYCS